MFCDNYYSSPKLFSALRREGIGAVGTCRKNLVAKGVRSAVEAHPRAEWGSIATEPIGDVLNITWLDNQWVNMLTTVHHGREQVVTNRRRPRLKSANGRMLQRVFGNE